MCSHSYKHDQWIFSKSSVSLLLYMYAYVYVCMLIKHFSSNPLNLSLCLSMCVCVFFFSKYDIKRQSCVRGSHPMNRFCFSCSVYKSFIKIDCCSSFVYICINIIVQNNEEIKRLSLYCSSFHCFSCLVYFCNFCILSSIHSSFFKSSSNMVLEWT